MELKINAKCKVQNAKLRLNSVPSGTEFQRVDKPIDTLSDFEKGR